VKVRVGIGRALVDVPSNVSLVLDGHSGAGAVNLTTRHTDGTSASDHVRIMRSEGTPVLHIDARVGIGQVEVLRPGDQADAGFLPPPKRKIIIEPNPSVRSLP
jgi:predicted membrane protein